MKTVLAIALLSLVYVNAWAAEEGAEGLIGKGVSLRRQGKHAEALDLFKRAHEVAPSGRTLAQMGLAEQSLQKWADSEAHLGQALGSGDGWVEKNRPVISDVLSAVKVHVGSVEVTGPKGGQVYIDGQEVGRLPMAPVRRSEGPLRVEVKLAGQTWAHETTVVAGQVVKVEAPIQEATAANARSAESASSPLDSAPSHPMPFTWKTPVGSGLIGAGLAGLGVGILALVHGQTGACSGNVELCANYFDATTVGVVSSALGAAAMISGGVLLYLDRRESRAVSVGLSTTGVMMAGKF